MPTETALVIVNTVANMSGIAEAKAGLAGLQAQTLLLTAAVGGMVLVGKAAIENAKKQNEAFDQLTQAYSTQKDTLDAHKAAILDFIKTNKGFISDQYDTETAMAAVIRAGYNTTDMLRIMNDALDLAAINHDDVSTEATKLTLVLTGNGRALRELGISTETYNKIMKDKTLTLEEKHSKLLDLIESKTNKGKDAIDGMEQKQNKLNQDWQDLTSKLGPPLLDVLGKVADAADIMAGILQIDVDLLDKLTHMDPGSLLKIAQILNFINDPVGAAKTIFELNKKGGKPVDYTTDTSGTHGGYKGGKASGGSVSAGSAYTVGEHGPETLVMGAQGGSIIPHGGGNEIHIHMHGMVIDGPAMDKFFREGLRRARYAPGT